MALRICVYEMTSSAISIRFPASAGIYMRPGAIHLSPRDFTSGERHITHRARPDRADALGTALGLSGQYPSSGKGAVMCSFSTAGSHFRDLPKLVKETRLSTVFKSERRSGRCVSRSNIPAFRCWPRTSNI